MSVINITNDNFQKEILESDRPVLVDFWASWCGPCRMVGPVIEELSEEREDIKVCKVNVDEEQSLAQEFQIMSIPTLMVVKEGKVENRSVGVKSKEQILEMF